jgi:hypothetical protein
VAAIRHEVGTKFLKNRSIDQYIHWKASWKMCWEEKAGIMILTSKLRVWNKACWLYRPLIHSLTHIHEAVSSSGKGLHFHSGDPWFEYRLNHRGSQLFSSCSLSDSQNRVFEQIKTASFLIPTYIPGSSYARFIRRYETCANETSSSKWFRYSAASSWW